MADAAPERHPWHDTDLPVVFTSLDDGQLGAWDPDAGVIFLAHGLTQAERRSTLTHEAIHAERGDEPCGHELAEHKQERIVAREAARRLIPLDRLADVLRWTLDETELAEDLWVDLDTVRTRLAALTDAEKAYIDEKLWGYVRPGS